MENFQEQEPGGPEYCACPDCDYETTKRRGIPCRSMVCPECGARLEARVEPESEEETEETALDPLYEALRDGIAATEVALAVVNGSGELGGEDADGFLRSLRAELLERQERAAPVGETVLMDAEALEEYGRRVSAEQRDKLQKAVDDFQSWIDEIQEKLLSGEEVLLAFEEFLRWAQYDDAAMWQNRGGKAVPIQAAASDFQEQGEEGGMPYGKMEDVNPAIRGIEPPVTLAQANVIAGWADAMEESEDGPENPWAAAIAQFKEQYEVRDGRWVKKEAAEELGEATDADREAKDKRAEKYGIRAIEGKPVTKPSEYEDVPEASFGDPTNWAWPCDEEHAKAAIGYFNRSGMREDGGYTPEDWAKVGERLAKLLTKYMPAAYQYKDGKLVQAEQAKEAHMEIIEALRAGEVEQVITALEASNTAMLALRAGARCYRGQGRGWGQEGAPGAARRRRDGGGRCVPFRLPAAGRRVPR